jgi:small-conductance mechanosensitive channel
LFFTAAHDSIVATLRRAGEAWGRFSDMISWTIIVAVLLGLEFWAGPEIHSVFPKQIAAGIDQAIEISLIVALSLLLDSCLRHLFWRGYLKRRRGVDTPALIQDIVTVLLFVTSFSFGLIFIADFSVTGIVTASGAITVILGLALQAVIQDLFSGLAINFEGSYTIGDWLTIYTDQMPAPIYGCVTHISWRSTYLSLPDLTQIIVPNHMVTNNPVLNHSRPRESKRISVEVCLDNRLNVPRASEIILGEAYKVARRSPGLARNPEPTVIVTRMDPDAVFYEVRFHYRPEEIEPTIACSLMLTAILDIIQKTTLPTPASQVELMKEPKLSATFGLDEQRALIGRTPLLESVLNPDHIEILLSKSVASMMPAGTVLMNQGDEGSSMFIIAQGAASVTIKGDSGQSHEVNILAAGDVVGEMSLLTGAPRTASVVALTTVHVLEIPKAAVEAVLIAAPNVAERLSKVLAERQAQNAAIAHRLIKREDVERDLLARIRTFFFPRAPKH